MMTGAIEDFRCIDVPGQDAPEAQEVHMHRKPRMRSALIVGALLVGLATAPAASTSGSAGAERTVTVNAPARNPALTAALDQILADPRFVGSHVGLHVRDASGAVVYANDVE